MWNKDIEKRMSSEELLGVWKTTTRRVDQRIPTLEENGAKYTTTKENKEILGARRFPTAAEHDEEGREKEEGEKERISMAEARKAYKNMWGLKAPVEVRIVVKAMKGTMECLGEWIRKLYKTSRNNGKQPKEWMKAITAIIPKSGKSDYTKVESYQAVSLVKTQCKAQEMIVTGRLTGRGERDKMEGLHVQQWGGVRGRSAEECVEATLK